MTFTKDSEIDLLVCGSCQRDFPLERITSFMQHKKFECDEFSRSTDDSVMSTHKLLCQTCPEQFSTPWKLLKHAQHFHNLRIFMEAVCDESAESNKEISVMKICSVPMRMTKSSENNTKQIQTNTVTLPKVAHPTQSQHFLPGGGVQGLTRIPGKNSIQSKGLPSTAGVENMLSHVPTAIGNTTVAFQTISALGEPEEHYDLSMPTVQSAAGGVITQSPHPNCDDEGILINQGTDNSNLPKSGIGKSSKIANLDKVDKRTSDIGIQTSDIKVAELSADKGTKSCCNSQDCGVTVMPGTHESLKKCCSAVVPKKRKRHMETKHMTYGGKTKRRLRSVSQMKIGESSRSHGSPSIFIDVEPHSSDIEDLDYQEYHSSKPVNVTLASTTSKKTSPSNSSNMSTGQKDLNTSAGLGDSFKGRKNWERSVIIKPGSTFSIPVSYSRNIQPSIGISAASFKRTEMADACPSTLTSTVPTLSPSQFLASPMSMHTVVQSDQSSLPPCQTLPVISSILNPKIKYEIHSKPSAPTLPSASKVDTDSTEHQSSQHKEEEQHSSDDAGEESKRDSYRQRQKKRRYPTSRPFKCDKCDNAFNQRIHLKKHQSKHTGIKPFKCDQCDYSTVERSHLKVHIRVHTGEKPFKCTYCEYATAQNSTLKIHLQRHHNRSEATDPTSDKPAQESLDNLACQTCHMTFPKEETLNAHSCQADQEQTQAEEADGANTDNTDHSSVSGTTSQVMHSTLANEVSMPVPQTPVSARTGVQQGSSGMLMTVDDNSVTFTGSGLQQVLSLLGKSLQQTAHQTSGASSPPKQAEHN